LIEDSIPRKIVLAFGQTWIKARNILTFAPVKRLQEQVATIFKGRGKRKAGEIAQIQPLKRNILKSMRRPVRGFFEPERRGAAPRDKETDSTNTRI
jgi:hypothetical protein